MCTCDMAGAGRTTCVGMVPGTRHRMPVMVDTTLPSCHSYTAQWDLRPGYPLLCYPFHSLREPWDALILPSCPSPGGSLLLWNVLASLPAGVNILYS